MDSDDDLGMVLYVSQFITHGHLTFVMQIGHNSRKECPSTVLGVTIEGASNMKLIRSTECCSMLFQASHLPLVYVCTNFPGPKLTPRSLL